jgi:hypothetical protein
MIKKKSIFPHKRAKIMKQVVIPTTCKEMMLLDEASMGPAKEFIWDYTSKMISAKNDTEKTIAGFAIHGDDLDEVNEILETMGFSLDFVDQTINVTIYSEDVLIFTAK